MTMARHVQHGFWGNGCLHGVQRTTMPRIRRIPMMLVAASAIGWAFLDISSGSVEEKINENAVRNNWNNGRSC